MQLDELANDRQAEAEAVTAGDAAPTTYSSGGPADRGTSSGSGSSSSSSTGSSSSSSSSSSSAPASEGTLASDEALAALREKLTGAGS